MKRILYCLNHPSDFFTFKHVIPRLNHMGYESKVLFTPKSFLADLPWTGEWDCINLYQAGQSPNFFSSISLIWQFINQYNPQVVAGTDPSLAHASLLSGRRSLLFNQMDSSIRPAYKLAYTSARRFIVPQACDRSIRGAKRITFRGCHQLAYLKRKYFQPDESIKESMGLEREKYYLIRLSSMPAKGENGLGEHILRELVALFERHGQVFISTNSGLPEELEGYRLNIAPEDLHNAVNFSEMLISNSETMAAEAAVLGVPSVWVSPLAGRIGYMKELEETYGLTFGVKNNKPKELASTIKEILKTPDIKVKWRNKRKVLQVETDDVSEFFTDAIRIYAEKKKV